MSKTLNDMLKAKLLAMKPENFTVSKITELFGYHATRDGKISPPLIYPNDIVNLKAGEYINKKDVKTTAGRILLNKIIIEGKIQEIIPDGYYNEIMTAKAFKKLSEMLADSLISEKITVDQLVSFLKAFEFYGLKACPIFSPSFTEGVLKPKKEVIDERDRQLKTKDINNMTTDEIVDLEDMLVNKARIANKNDAGMTLYDSGSRGSFDNDYKNIAVMIGAMANPETGKVDLMTSNYMDGIKKEDIPMAANGVVNASYPRAVNTAVGGYLTKQFYSVFQSIMLDKKGTDCGSKFTLNFVLTEGKYKDYEFQYIVDNGKLVELNPNTKKKYIGKLIHMRTPEGCLNDKTCNCCAGNRYYYTGIVNVGLTTGRVSNTLMQKQMKKFHNQKLHHSEVDPSKLLL